MANPSSSHHRERTDRERERERHHHHRTVSSTTLLLALSLILAVLAVMLSLPSNRNTSAAPAVENAPTESNIWTYLSPRRSQALVQREHEVAIREAEVARREAELLAGSVAGLAQKTAVKQSGHPSATPVPTETVIKEVVREVETIGAGRAPTEIRLDDVMQREERVSDREKEVGHREETVGKRETDASRRENWIMEQLIALGNDPAPVTIETEEYTYDSPRRSKVQSLPKVVVNAETHTETLTRTVTKAEGTKTVTLEPAHTRLAAQPVPEEFVRSGKFTAPSSATSAVEVTLDELAEDVDAQPSTVERTVTVVERPRATRRILPRRSFWNW